MHVEKEGQSPAWVTLPICLFQFLPLSLCLLRLIPLPWASDTYHSLPAGPSLFLLHVTFSRYSLVWLHCVNQEGLFKPLCRRATIYQSSPFIFCPSINPMHFTLKVITIFSHVTYLSMFFSVSFTRMCVHYDNRCHVPWTFLGWLDELMMCWNVIGTMWYVCLLSQCFFPYNFSSIQILIVWTIDILECFLTISYFDAQWPGFFLTLLGHIMHYIYTFGEVAINPG